MDQQQQQQTQQTEKLIEEMLEFLDSTSEEEDDPANLTAEEQQHKATLEPNKDFNDNNIKQEGGEKLNLKVTNDYKKGKKSKTSIAKELRKLKQQYPIWNTKEIVSINTKKNPNNPQPPVDEPIWSQSSLNLLSKSKASAEGVDSLPISSIDNDWHTKLESNCRRSSSNSYIQEVQKAIYGDSMGHPPNGSSEYYQAAQNYAVSGKHFLDFPENLQTILNDKPNCSSENPNFVNGLYPMTQGHVGLGSNGNNGYVGGGILSVGYNNNGKPNTTTANTISGSSTSAVAAAAASTAAYYQMCNGMQAQARPTVSNASAGNAAAYGIFLGNKVTYVAAPTAPSMVYNQHSSTTTNFISNSLANAALATSPAILYSNPMLTTTTQQYLNTFFKETQFLSTGATAGNSAQGSAVGSTTTGIYERLVYAQMLQQQIYHQTQQAAAVAAMFQHKQRANAAAAAAAANAISRQPSNGGNVNIMTTANNASAASATPAKTPSATILPALNPCSRQAAMSVSNSPTPIATNSSAIPAIVNDDVSNVLND